MDGSAADSAWSWRGSFVEAYMQSGLVVSCTASGLFLMGAFVLGRAWGLERRTGRKEGLTEEGRREMGRWAEKPRERTTGTGIYYSDEDVG